MLVESKVVVNAAPRPWTWRLLGLIVLSLLHVFAFALFAVPGLGIVSVIYFAGGLLLLACFYSQLGSASKQLRDVECYTSRDDFKWLVTSAPLATRQCLHRAVQNAISQTTPSELPPS